MDGIIGWLPWLFLAAVVFFALGWLGARHDAKRLLSESRVLPQSYFKGLNFLLNEQPDQALEALIEAGKQHPEAIELQFALGSLFRRRGEVDRALRVHKELSERSGLTDQQRAAALYETALDYHRSGLLDHAEKILCDLLEKHAGSESQHIQTLKLLLDLYEQERNWRRAIDIARMLDSDVPQLKRQYVSKIANFLCESAIELRASNHAVEAWQLLDRALAENSTCVRANLLRGEWQAKDGNHRDAIATWTKITEQDPAYLGLAADAMLASFDAQGQSEQGLAELRQMQQQHPGLDLLNALFKATLASAGPQAAYQLVKDDLRHHPTLVGLDRLLEAQVLAAPENEKPELAMLSALVHAHASRLAVYLCKGCGFKAKQFYWHCPACGGWDTFPPRRTAEYDTAERHLAQLQADHINNR